MVLITHSMGLNSKMNYLTKSCILFDLFSDDLFWGSLTGPLQGSPVLTVLALDLCNCHWCRRQFSIGGRGRVTVHQFVSSCGLDLTYLIPMF